MDGFSKEFLEKQQGRILERIGRYLNKERIDDELLSGDVSAYTVYKQTVLVPILRKTLTKIEKGTYGLCEDCGARIEEIRLELVPAAERCIKCMK